MELINLTIDGIATTVEKGTTILEAAKGINIHIPTLCFLKELNEVGSCRVCTVELENSGSLRPACVAQVAEGMVVNTRSKIVKETRKNMLELIMASHNRECLSCTRNLNCELQTLCNDHGISAIHYSGRKVKEPSDKSGPIVKDNSKCILCGRCISVCSKSQDVGVIDFGRRGAHMYVATPFNKGLSQLDCISCGQCIKVCPVAALSERDDTAKVWDALYNPNLHVIVQTAPSVRVALGEEFGFPVGTNVEGKMITALKRLGFTKVFDTNFSADLTIMEEGTELINRIKNGGKLPLITSCSPGWIKYCEQKHHDFIENLSSCKSPQQMFGAIAKSYYAEKVGIDPKDIFIVSVMPCTAKKYEADREEMAVDGYRDIDAVITTRELARMIRQGGIKFKDLKDGTIDSILGEYSGAGNIFGNTGGVMEAALRTVADVLTGEALDRIEYQEVRGIAGIKSATLNIAGMDIKVAVANGTGNAGKLLDSIRNGEENYHFIEIMGCEGGCINGGGQPIIQDKSKTDEVKLARIKGLYDIDEACTIRKSHENHEVQKVYSDYLGEPGGHKAHKILHTHYTVR
ncbi:MAG: NADH-dependent [FeFe] hydrogenase, group A6 [Lachnospirales bacterium]